MLVKKPFVTFLCKRLYKNTHYHVNQQVGSREQKVITKKKQQNERVGSDQERKKERIAMSRIEGIWLPQYFQ